MKIVVFKNKKLYKRLKEVEELYSYEIFYSDLIDNIDLENTLVIIDLKHLKEAEAFLKNTPFLLYSSKKELHKAIKYLKKGAIDILAGTHDNSEIAETIENAVESLQLFKNKVLNKELERIKNIAFQLFSSYNLKQSLENTIKFLKEVLNIERVFISIVKRNKEKILAGDGPEIEKLKKTYSKIKKHVWLTELKEKKDFVEFNKNQIKELEKAHKKEFIKFPLFLKDNLIGVLTIDNYDKPLPTNLNTEFIMIVSLLLSIHIENYKIYSEVIKTKEALRKKEEKEFLQKLTMSLNHEINNPLTIAYLNLESLKRKITQTDILEKNLSGLEISLERIKGIMDNINKIESERFVKSMRKRELIDFRYEA